MRTRGEQDANSRPISVTLCERSSAGRVGLAVSAGRFGCWTLGSWSFPTPPPLLKRAKADFGGLSAISRRHFLHHAVNQPLASQKPRRRRRLIPMVRKIAELGSHRGNEVDCLAPPVAGFGHWTSDFGPGASPPSTINHQLFFYLPITRRYPQLRAATRRLPRFPAVRTPNFAHFGARTAESALDCGGTTPLCRLATCRPVLVKTLAPAQLWTLDFGLWTPEAHASR
jgi:hypothetical protein